MYWIVGASSGVLGALIGGATVYYLGLQSPTEGVVPVAAVAGLLGTLVGSLLAFVLKRHELKVAETTARVDDVVAEIKAIEEVATEYWSRVYNAGDRLIEQRLTGRLHRLSQLITYCGPDGWEESDTVLKSRHLAFRDGVSGGDFESAGRREDFHRVRTITGAAGQLIVSIRQARRRAM